VTDVAGTCDARFASVRDALRENLESRGDVGAAVCVAVEGRVVADLWGGRRGADGAAAWERDTVVCVFSVGKALAALCALRLVDRGALALDEPLSRRWPELRGGDATVRDLLGHRAGLAAIRRPLPDGALYDWKAVTAALAGQEPWWPPGAACGYHVHTFGFLVGEVVRRVAGAPLRAVFDREVARPLGADVWFGLPPARRARRADYLFGELTAGATGAPGGAPSPPERAELRRCAYANPPGATGVGTVNSEAWLDAELPSANAHATARGVAAIYAALLDGRLLGAGTLDAAIAEASVEEDLVLGRPSRFGLGFQLTQPERPLGPNPRSFGHFGAGGSLGFADPDAGVAFGYVMNSGGPRWRNPRNRALIDAVYAAL